MPNKVKVHVEYCCSCLSTRYLELNLKILKECDKQLLKNLKIDGKVGRRYTFEVTINDQLVFSKLKTGAFPDFDAIIEQIVRAYKGKEIKEITKFENLDPVCKLL